MIKFFRHIRKALLAENKFSKYLLYAIGEIILVVIGILIALQINNWSEENKSKRYEKELLTDILQNLNKDIEHNRNVAIPWIEKFLNHSDIVLKAYGKPNTRMDTMQIHFKNMLRSPDFAYTIGAYETLKSKGLEKIENKKLRQEIIDLYDFKIPRTERFVTEVYSREQPSIITLKDNLFDLVKSKDVKGKLTISRDAKESLLNNKDLLLLIRKKQWIGNHALMRLNTILSHIESLKTNIEKELKK